MPLAFVAPFDKVFAVLEQCRPVIALAFDFVAQGTSPRVVSTFSFVNFFQNVNGFFVIEASSVRAVERTSEKDVVD